MEKNSSLISFSNSGIKKKNHMSTILSFQFTVSLPDSYLRPFQRNPDQPPFQAIDRAWPSPCAEQIRDTTLQMQI